MPFSGREQVRATRRWYRGDDDSHRPTETTLPVTPHGLVEPSARWFEAAIRGTLLLDEIGEVPPPTQVTLLRALQERQIRRVGENRNRAVSARVIAATNRDLVKEIRAARFREDLYYRLCAAPPYG